MSTFDDKSALFRDCARSSSQGQKDRYGLLSWGRDRRPNRTNDTQRSRCASRAEGLFVGSHSTMQNSVFARQDEIYLKLIQLFGGWSAPGKRDRVRRVEEAKRWQINWNIHKYDMKFKFIEIIFKFRFNTVWSEPNKNRRVRWNLLSSFSPYISRYLCIALHNLRRTNDPSLEFLSNPSLSMNFTAPPVDLIGWTARAASRCDADWFVSVERAESETKQVPIMCNYGTYYAPCSHWRIESAFEAGAPFARNSSLWNDPLRESTSRVGG